MGYLDFREQPEYLKKIKSTLRRRNLFMDKADGWEVHGPHPNMDYEVYIGRAYKDLDFNLRCTCRKDSIFSCKRHKKGFYVAIYPWAVYGIEYSDKWGSVEPRDRIRVPK